MPRVVSVGRFGQIQHGDVLALKAHRPFIKTHRIYLSRAGPSVAADVLPDPVYHQHIRIPEQDPRHLFLCFCKQNRLLFKDFLREQGRKTAGLFICVFHQSTPNRTLAF